MTTTEAPEDAAAPASFDPVDSLTLAELDAGSRLLKASLIRAVVEKTVDYERGWAILAYLHARRTDRTTPPDELLRRFTSMGYSQVSDYLLSLAPAGDDDAADPTEPGRA